MSWPCRKWFCLLSTVILRFVFQKQQYIFFPARVDKFRCKYDRHEKFYCDKKVKSFASFKSTACSDQKRSSLTKDHVWDWCLRTHQNWCFRKKLFHLWARCKLGTFLSTQGKIWTGFLSLLVYLFSERPNMKINFHVCVCFNSIFKHH